MAVQFMAGSLNNRRRLLERGFRGAPEYRRWHEKDNKDQDEDEGKDDKGQEQAERDRLKRKDTGKNL